MDYEEKDQNNMAEHEDDFEGRVYFWRAEYLAMTSLPSLCGSAGDLRVNTGTANMLGPQICLTYVL